MLCCAVLDRTGPGAGHRERGEQSRGEQSRAEQRALGDGLHAVLLCDWAPVLAVQLPSPQQNPQLPAASSFSSCVPQIAPMRSTAGHWAPSIDHAGLAARSWQLAAGSPGTAPSPSPVLGVADKVTLIEDERGAPKTPERRFNCTVVVKGRALIFLPSNLPSLPPCSRLPFHYSLMACETAFAYNTLFVNRP